MEPPLLADVKGLQLLHAMSEAAREKVAGVFLGVAETWELGDGEALMHEGHLGFDSGYVLTRGDMSIERAGTDSIVVSAPALLGEMSQFKSSDARSATVRASGPAVVLHFHWEEFYEQAKAALSDAEYAQLMDALEQLVWERCGCQPLLNLDLFRGLDDALKLKVCIIFPWITDRVKVKAGGTLFDHGARCQSEGHLLLSGALRLVKPDRTEKLVNAPNLVGVMPKHEPGLAWTASAIAQSDADILKFSWLQYTGKLQQRLTGDELRRLIEAMKANAAAHFWH